MSMFVVMTLVLLSGISPLTNSFFRYYLKDLLKELVGSVDIGDSLIIVYRLLVTGHPFI